MDSSQEICYLVLMFRFSYMEQYMETQRLKNVVRSRCGLGSSGEALERR